MDEMEFEDEDAVKVWMIDNQSNRRNITTAAKIRLKARKIAILQKRAEERMKAGKKTDPSADRREPQELFEKGKVSEAIAEEVGCDTRTVERFQYIEKHADPKLVQDLH